MNGGGASEILGSEEWGGGNAGRGMLGGRVDGGMDRWMACLCGCDVM